MKSSITPSVLAFVFTFSAIAGTPPAKTPELIAKGKAVYQTACVTCHGVKGDGMGDAGKYMSPKPRNFATEKFKKGESVSEVYNTVLKGLDGTAMVGFPGLSEDERWAVSYYVLTFKK